MILRNIKSRKDNWQKVGQCSFKGIGAAGGNGNYQRIGKVASTTKKITKKLMKLC
jgi:hypothetical protein